MSGENTNPQAGPGIGRRLEEARESMGLSLWQVEQETRIRSRYLRDLEREEFGVLPAVYVLGSLKTYADFLGLDGAALSRQLKPRLVGPAEPDVTAQLAVLGGRQGEDDEYEAAPAPSVGFDQLFLGMGVILISILAVMTLVTAVAQGDQSPVSQINQPSTPESPSEIALAGDVQDEDSGREDGGRNTDENKEDRPEDKPETPKNGADEEDKNGGEDGEDQNDGDGEDQSGEDAQDDGDAQDEPQAASFFDGVEFVPVSPSSTRASASAGPSSAASASTAPSLASPAPSSPTPSSPASSSPAPSSPAPATVEPDDSPASPAPAATGASRMPADGGPDAAPAPPDPPVAVPTEPEGGGRPLSSPQPVVADPDRISAEADAMIGEVFEERGIDP